VAGGAKGAAKVLANLLDPPPPMAAASRGWQQAERVDAARTAPPQPPTGSVAFGVLPPLPKAGGDPAPMLSMRDTVSRWYGAYEGGFDRAVAESQQAMKDHPIPNYQFYGPWSAAEVDRKFPVNFKGLPQHIDGEYNGLVNIRRGIDPAKRDATLEHEITHGVTMAAHKDELNRQYPDNPTPEDRNRRIMAGNAMVDQRSEFWADSGHDVDMRQLLTGLINKKHSAGPDDARAHVDEHLRNYIQEHAEYLSEASELDPRIAEVRRHYTWNTGEGVRSPEEAEKAWKWFGDNLQGIKEANSASMTPMAYRLYDGLPEGVKRIMYARMTHIPAVLGPVGAASMVAGQDRE